MFMLTNMTDIGKENRIVIFVDILIVISAMTFVDERNGFSSHSYCEESNRLFTAVVRCLLSALFVVETRIVAIPHGISSAEKR